MAAAVAIETYKNAMIVLGAASLVVPLMNRAGVSPILGFLFAGALLGPKGLGALQDYVPALSWITVTAAEDMTRIAELGVVFLLFVIGLELSLPRFLTMRRLVFGLGTLQVCLSAAIISLIGIQLGLGAPGAMVLGMALALSSTAIVIEVLSRQHRLTTATGRTSFAILLFQDLAVVPVLIFVGLLAAEDRSGSVIERLAIALGQGTLALAVIVGLGRFVIKPLFRAVAGADNTELFTAATLFVVVGTSLISAAAGLSMALGAFVAGLLLAETEYRRAVEATIEPFKGLLLGFFFFYVGMSLDIGLLLRNPLLLVGSAVLLVIIKGAVVALLAKAFGSTWVRAIDVGLMIGPAGEFAFVIIGIAMTAGLVTGDTGAFALSVASLTMAAIPALAVIGRRFVNRLEHRIVDPELKAVPGDASGVQAIVVGYGRVGRIVSDLLEEHGIRHIVTDREPVLVSKWRREGKPIYFGDAQKPGFLASCGVRTVKAVIITINDAPEIDRIVEAVRGVRPDAVIVSRARDASHARHLYEMGVADAVPETVEASLQLSEAALVGLGVPTGLVIASVHEKRDEFRQVLQDAAGVGANTTRALRATLRRSAAEKAADS